MVQSSRYRNLILSTDTSHGTLEEAATTLIIGSRRRRYNNNIHLNTSLHKHNGSYDTDPHPRRTALDSSTAVPHSYKGDILSHWHDG